MNADAYLLAVREALQEPEADVWTDVQLFRYLTWSQDGTWRLLVSSVPGDHFLEETSPMDIVSGTQEYTIPVGPNSTNMMMLRFVERVWSTADGFLERIPFDHRARYSTIGGTSAQIGYPQKYYLKFPKVGFAPSPEVNISGAVVFHGIFKLEAMAAGGSAPRFDDYDVCQRICVTRAAMYAKHLDEQSDLSLVGEYKAAKLELVRDYDQDDGALWVRDQQEDGI